MAAHRRRDVLKGAAHKVRDPGAWPADGAPIWGCGHGAGYYPAAARDPSAAPFAMARGGLSG